MALRHFYRTFASKDPVAAILSTDYKPKFKTPESSDFYKVHQESKGIFGKSPQTSNQPLAYGKAQSLRVNNPYNVGLTASINDYENRELKHGISAAREIGGDNVLYAGIEYIKMNRPSGHFERNKRTRARIFYREQIAMQRVKIGENENIGGGPWSINFEVQNMAKHGLEGMNVILEPDIQQLHGFMSVHAAIKYCRLYGYAFDVEMPHHRKPVKKNYGDNFKFKPLKK